MTSSFSVAKGSKLSNFQEKGLTIHWDLGAILLFVAFLRG